MRIAQVAPLYESVPPKLYGGTERVVSYLTEQLVDHGHDVTLFASGGGASSIYAKPSWQSGPGVPNDGKRDLPDVSLAAAALHDGYLLCQDGSCLTDGQGRLFNAEVIGGTSASAPTA